MKPLTRSILGLAVLGAALLNPGAATPIQAQVDAAEVEAAEVAFALSCEASGALRGTAEGSFGGQPFVLACDATTPMDQSLISGVTDPDGQAWQVTLILAERVCESSGTGLPMFLSCGGDAADEATITFAIAAL